jgi:Na+:H+ antiporter, NhaA family
MPPIATQTPGPAANVRRLARALSRPLRRFVRIEGASGIVLVAAATAALGWANTRAAATYPAFWDTAVGAGDLAVTPRFVVNDVLMSLFFFVIGLELRRERAIGALRDRRQALLPVFAALGGMVAPALIYLAMNRGEAARGWAIPVATDVAFALGVLALAGRQIPASVRVFVLALAILDDLGAILVVAVFYSRGLGVDGLALAALGIGAILWMQRRRIEPPLAYLAPAVAIWCGLARAEIHPTLAGAIVGLMTPAGERPDAPAARLEGALQPWVAFGVMPVFALANAGLDLRSLHVTAPGVIAGTIAGLVIGKPAGIVAASALAVRLGVASLPPGTSWRGMLLIGTVAGIGFTMSLFISDLAFADQPELLAHARLGLLAGSLVAAAGALVCAWLVRRERALAA